MLFLVFWFLSVLVALYGVYNQAQMMRNRKREVSLLHLLNPFTFEMFRKDNLKPEALPFRRRAFISMVFFCGLFSLARLCFLKGW